MHREGKHRKQCEKDLAHIAGSKSGGKGTSAKKEGGL